VLTKQAVTPPGEAREDWRIICDLARRFAPWDKFPYSCPEDIFRELRRVSQGGPIDYYGITYDRIEKEHGVFWPCPEVNHPGTPRLYEGGKFHHPDGKARFHAVEYRPPAEDVDEEYPVILTSGRVVSQYLSGTQTRRIGPLVKPIPGAARRDPSETCGENRDRERRSGKGDEPPRVRDAEVPGREDDPARHDLHSVPLGGGEVGEPPHDPRARSCVEDPGVQGVRGSGGESAMKNESRKSKTENRGRGPSVASLRRERQAKAKEQLCVFEHWFSNWVLHRD
jgi:hypothetical protein